VRALLQGVGFTRFGVGPTCPDEAEAIHPSDCPSTGIALGVFKALQIIATRKGEQALGDFTAVDIETTDKDVMSAEIVDLAAVRVRNGVIVDEWSSLVKPRVPMNAAAAATHGITEAELALSPYFEEVWPAFREFCGKDVLIAHNGYRFDFPILDRMSKPHGGHSFITYDTLVLARELHPGSRRLVDLALRFQVDTGKSHRALDDSRALAHVFVKLDGERLTRSRKTALANLLDHLAVAVALDAKAPPSDELLALRKALPPYALGRYSDVLEQYRVQRELSGDPNLPGVEELIELLGGKELMVRLRAERTADDRYPRPWRDCGG
jgi:DNA polymerase III epsilon subunit-like protein